MSQHTNVEEIAAQFDRLWSDQVDNTESGNGNQTAGHSGHDQGDGTATIGWFCDGGNVGEPLCRIAVADLDSALARLIKMAPGPSLREVVDSLRAQGVLIA